MDKILWMICSLYADALLENPISFLLIGTELAVIAAYIYVACRFCELPRTTTSSPPTPPPEDADTF